MSDMIDDFLRKLEDKGFAEDASGVQHYYPTDALLLEQCHFGQSLAQGDAIFLYGEYDSVTRIPIIRLFVYKNSDSYGRPLNSHGYRIRYSHRQPSEGIKEEYKKLYHDEIISKIHPN